MTTYLLDANVFIQGKNLHYGFDFCPAFWDWIDEAHATKIVYSIEGVRAELMAGNDELATWAGNRPPGFFLAPGAASVPSLQATSTWADELVHAPGQPSTVPFLKDRGTRRDLLSATHALQHDAQPPSPLPGSPRERSSFRYEGTMRPFGMTILIRVPARWKPG